MAQRSGPRALRGAEIRIPAGPQYDRIADLEFARDPGNGNRGNGSPGDGELVTFLVQGAPAIRARAAVALGRMPFPEHGVEVTAALCRALADPDPEVRMAIALAIGTRGDPNSGGCLANHWNDGDPRVRAALARAAAHIDTPEVREAVRHAMRDPELQVCIEAVQATALWDPASRDARDIDRALLEVLAGGARGSGELRWRTLYALARRRSDRGRGAFLDYASSPETLERLFAIRGLARLGPAPGGLAVLLAALEDSDWRIATEAATGLGSWGDSKALEGLLEAVDHPSPHVRRTATAAIGELGIDGREVRRLLWRASRDISTGVRVAALVSLARLLSPEEARDAVDEYRRDSDPLTRVGAAEAASRLPSGLAVPLLSDLARDGDVRVAGAALSALADHPGASARSVLHRGLESTDNGLVAAAAGALAEQAGAAEVPFLLRALERVRGEVSIEATLELLRALAHAGGTEAEHALQVARSHSNRWVRKVASELLGLAPTPPAATNAPAPTAPRPVEDYPRWQRNPLVEVLTTRGSMLFELFPAEAPLHVHNLLELAARGHYERLLFHRVVPDFVIQGGDVRGDGNGGSSWLGEPLPHEFGARKFRRGSLGMPRSADPDSGGSQLFVTHRPTPHLDGRYTILGELRAGGEVLDEIEVGDRILEIRLFE